LVVPARQGHAPFGESHHRGGQKEKKHNSRGTRP
jgi:hypothetical protein